MPPQGRRARVGARVERECHAREVHDRVGTWCKPGTQVVAVGDVEIPRLWGADDLMPGRLKLSTEPPPDESSGPGDEDSHRD